MGRKNGFLVCLLLLLFSLSYVGFNIAETKTSVGYRVHDFDAIVNYKTSAALTSSYTDVNVSEAKIMIDSNPSLVILDVRNQSEYDSGHVGNARLIPLYELEGRLNELNKTDEILVYCKYGARSTNASQILSDNGFLYVYNMIGGIIAWKSAGYPVYVKYSSIQEAINNANAGQTICVSSGIYYENLIISKPLTLVGENKYTTIIDANSIGTVILVQADNTSISRFTTRKSGCACGDHGGVNVENCQNVKITDNLITQNGIGIRLNLTRTIIAAYNNITNNDFSGFELWNSSNNIISGNNITGNGMFGIWLDESSNNRIFHNNFMENPQNVYPVASSNSWDDGYPSGGNYWSGHAGADFKSGPNQDQLGSDGIVDTPYGIDPNKDLYPLMAPFITFKAGTWNDVTYNVGVVSNSTVSGFTFTSDQKLISFNVTGLNDTVGFSRVTIPNDLLGGPYDILVNGLPPLTINEMSKGTHTFLYFTYNHSTEQVNVIGTTVVPEFPSATILPLLLVLSTLAIAFKKRKLFGKLKT